MLINCLLISCDLKCYQNHGSYWISVLKHASKYLFYIFSRRKKLKQVGLVSSTHLFLCVMSAAVIWADVEESWPVFDLDSSLRWNTPSDEFFTSLLPSGTQEIVFPCFSLFSTSFHFSLPLAFLLQLIPQRLPRRRRREQEKQKKRNNE